MKCPVCKEATLMMSQRNNIEIDYCPQCRGVWLDRGELDKIIEYALSQDNAPAAPAPQAAPMPPPAQAQHYPPPGYPPHPHAHAHPEGRHPYDPNYHKRKKWWTDVFDFD